MPLASLAQAASASAPVDLAKAGTVQRRAAAWSITPGDASRAELAQQLAAQSGSRVIGDLSALQALSPLRQTAHQLDLQDAWRLVLGGSSNHALRCNGKACTVWLIGPSPAGPNANSASSVRAAPPDPPGPFPAEPPPEPA